MASVAKRMSQSFARLKEALGFGEEVSTRTIPFNKKELNQLRTEDPSVMDNIVRTSKYNIFTFFPVNLFQ